MPPWGFEPRPQPALTALDIESVMDQLRKELTTALQKYGIKTETIFKAVPSIKDVEQV